MDLKQKKQILVDEFNKNQQQLQQFQQTAFQLNKKQDQIIGALQLLEEMEKAEKENKKIK